MADPIAFAAGTTTASIGHSIKVTKVILLQASATAATAIVTDLGGNVIIPTMSVPATVGASSVLDYAVPRILPGAILPPVSGSPVPSFIVTVVGAGATLYLQYR